MGVRHHVVSSITGTQDIVDKDCEPQDPLPDGLVQAPHVPSAHTGFLQLSLPGESLKLYLPAGSLQLPLPAGSLQLSLPAGLL